MTGVTADISSLQECLMINQRSMFDRLQRFLSVVSFLQTGEVSGSDDVGCF